MSVFSDLFELISNNVLVSVIVALVLLKLLGAFGKAGPIEEFPGHKVQSVHSQAEWDAALATAAKDKKLVVVDFFATWCGPCRYAAPVFGKMSTEFEDVVFLKVDVDEMKSVAHNNNVKAMPTFLFFKNGRKVDSITGWSESRVRNGIATHK